MPKMERPLWLDCIVFIQLMHLCFACQMEGVTNWRLRVEERIFDTHNGVVLDRNTSDILGINSIVHSEGLNRGPYIDVKYENSRFIVATRANFAEYEEYETSKTMRVTVSFNCAQGSTNQPPLVIQIDIIDTNQNAPRFLPSDNYEFTVIPPLPPGFLVTGCDNQIIARDIDLTTQRVDFTIEENDYFEIFYDSSPASKEFSATLRAKMFIRSIPDDLSLKIMATDVDETSDPPLTTEGSVRIISDTQFQLPEELQFSKIFYLLNYTNENLVTDELILLNRGYDDQVTFSFEGDHKEYFEMTPNGNRITFRVKTEIPTEILREQQIYLIVRAEREHTSGAAATIIIQLPTASELSFELLSYKGVIDGISLVHQDIFLNQVNEDVVFGIRGDYANLFNQTSNGNQLIISLRKQLPQEIVTSNNIITLEITASGDYTNTAASTLIFEIIKDDLITPVFAKKIYEGKYVNSTHVSIEEIRLTQGYDGTVEFKIFGEHADYFRIENDDDNVIVSLRYAIPEDLIFSAKIFTLYIVATKLNTVGGNAALVIRFPNELTELAVMEFSKHTYIGTLENKVVSIENVILESGFTNQVRFILSGEYYNYFTYSTRENVISILASEELHENLGNEDNIILNVRAERVNAIPVTTSIVISIVKKEIIQPVFEKPYYKGIYTENVGLQFNDVIKLTSGLDVTVTFDLQGEHSKWFYITENEDSVILHPNTTNSIPNDFIVNNKQIVLTIIANKPEATPGRTVIVIELNAENKDSSLSFERVYYVGSLDKNKITLDTINLRGNLDEPYSVTLHGDLANYFSTSTQGDGLGIILEEDLPEDGLPDNNIITLEIRATRNTTIAQATVILKIIKEIDDKPTIKPIHFNRVYYTGQYSTNGLSFPDIISLSVGFDDTVEFELVGESSQWFYITQDENSVRLYENSTNTLPNEVVESNNQIVFTILAKKPGVLSAEAAVLIEFIKELDDTPTIKPIRFNRAYYTGQYSIDGLSFPDIISLSVGFDDTVEFELVGESSQWFYITQDENSVRLYENSTNTLPNQIVESNNQIVFTVLAIKPGALSAEAAIFIEIIPESSENLRFDRAYYVGSLNKSGITLEAISLIGNYDDTHSVTLHGNYANYFSITPQRPVFEIVLQREVSEDLLNNDFITLEIRVSKNDVITARATTILRIIKDNDPPVINGIQFDRVYYVGRYTSENVFTFEDTISLAEGYDKTVTYSLYGDQSTWFELVPTGSSAKMILSRQVPSDVVSSNSQLIFEVHANRASDTASARSTIIIAIEDVDDGSSPIMKFDRQAYVGTINQSVIFLDPIVLAEGYNDEVTFSLIGELNGYFSTPNERNVLTLTLLRPIPEENIPINRLITMDIQAISEYTTARAAIVLKIVQNQESVKSLSFDKPYYSGSYAGASEFSFDFIIRLESGFDETIQFKLEGDDSTWFRLRQSGNSADLELSSSIPESIINNVNQLVFVVYAQRVGSEVVLTRSVIIIAVTNDPITDVKFDKVLYLGRVENNAVVHEVITVVEFSGNVQVSGEYSHLFRAAITNGVVTITLSATSVPSTLSYVALKLIVDEANAVLLLDIYESDTPVDPPSLSFSSSSYILEANEGSTGEVGRVSAIASNGENVIYSLEIENEHLKQRLTVNNNGEIHLSASANLGVYSFKATARTRISQVSASAAVQLTIAELGTTFNLPPLLVLERDEEEPHLNLVPLDRTKYPNCEYSLSNKWPLDQNWLYVNSEGLHTRSIDREHDSIAFMPVSQIQVELNLNCNKRSKRSNVDTLDYGSNKWILTDSISYNPSRTLVNLIVRDINDNAPKFEADSVTVGYPSGDLAEIVLPRALAELKATDADIEENALLRYMSSDERFVVSPTSGSVHLRNRVTLEDNTRLVVDAVDRNGTGLKGSVEIMVRLLDRNQIAVVTVPSRFLDDESTILDELTNAVGYDVKPLRTTVISESRYDNEGDKSRERRDVNTNGASLRLYVYGLKQREPVDVTQLTDDLRNTMVTVSLARVLSLEDHLDELQICPAFEREIGLLAATIVLAVLLLIIILVFGVWFYLRRKIANDYDQFSDQNSLRSRNDSVESPKVEPVFTTPRLIGIEELRKSEKKLQERLDAPKEVPEKASSKNVEKTEAIINVSEPDSKWPIVIQSIDKLKDNTDESDDDEFGEKVRPRRKSVVTFNENVEKIIHLEDVSVDDNSEADVEVHKF
ncbi:protocadherin Fat 4 isoform X2 [Pieris rapae]|uniref:protocadherin Fat 4 isoform X2 n=1 Tax=Pieris rapae TaxID=64459 RepID=UPI001E27E65E|nr:protocadherin Fat 4 isoform X2 [Pieris rapae]